MSYSIIFFDLDGTLTDSKEGITKSVQYALAKFGIIETDRSKLFPFIGPPLNKSFQNFYGFSADKATQAVDYYREYFATKGMYENELYKNIPQMLQNLKSNQKLLYVVTSKPTFFSEKIVQHFKIDTYFTRVIGPKNDLSDADKHLLIQKALQLHPEIIKEQFVMVGDREHDIVGAQSNSIASIGVTYGAGTIDEIKNAQPTHIARSVQALEELLLQ